mmetsp:Transcript_35239/g.57974  ORF Transcript_35239/g.57974 Transcript_35239/m.57974 type:complete len:81 (+) Transcript_35239:691-933(+)
MQNRRSLTALLGQAKPLFGENFDYVLWRKRFYCLFHFLILMLSSSCHTHFRAGRPFSASLCSSYYYNTLELYTTYVLDDI